MPCKARRNERCFEAAERGTAGKRPSAEVFQPQPKKEGHGRLTIFRGCSRAGNACKMPIPGAPAKNAQAKNTHSTQHFGFNRLFGSGSLQACSPVR